MTQTLQEQADAELPALAQELGIELPMPVEQILWWEDQGADQRVTISETLRQLLSTEAA